MSNLWILVALAPLLDTFDRLFERYATSLQAYQASRDVWFDFGYLEPYENRDYRRRFFHLKLPSYEWTQSFVSRRWAWHQRVLWWSDGRGFHFDFWPVGE